MTPSIFYNFTKLVDVERLVSDQTGHNEEYAPYIQNLSAHIQPLDDSWTLDEVGSFGKEWLMFCDKQDIKEHDRIIYDDQYYVVVSVEDHDDFIGRRMHMEMRIRKHVQQKQND